MTKNMSTTLQTSTPAAESRVVYTTPRVNLHQTADTYTLEVELPGVGRDGVDVSVDDGQLVVTGHRQTGEQPGKPVYRERVATAYRRVFDLDPSIDTSKIAARLEQGVLTVSLQKVEAVKPRKITVS